MAALQRLAADPDMLLGAMQSDQQRHVMPQLAALVATIEGYVDHVLDTIGGRLLPDYDRVTEALRRRRVEAGPQTRFVERLFGLELSQATFDRGVDSWTESSTAPESTHWRSCGPSLDPLPTPADLDAPGLWLARLDIESTELMLDDGRWRSRISSIFRTRTDRRVVVASRRRPLATLAGNVTRPAGHGS